MKNKTLIWGILFSSLTLAKAPEKVLALIEVAPVNSSDYVLSAESNEYQAISDFTLGEVTAEIKRCNLTVLRDFRHKDEETIYKTIRELSKKQKETLVVGLSQSNIARVAAKAAQNTQIVGLSIGAASSQLKDINPNFVSIASPWTLQWDRIKNKMSSLGCNKEKTIGIFDLANHVSLNLRDVYRKEIGGKELLFTSTSVDSSFKKTITQFPCVIVALKISESEQILTTLDESSQVKHVFGPGEWNMYRRAKCYP
jgi:hypothetical protein